MLGYVFSLCINKYCIALKRNNWILIPHSPLSLQKRCLYHIMSPFIPNNFYLNVLLLSVLSLSLVFNHNLTCRSLKRGNTVSTWLSQREWYSTRSEFSISFLADWILLLYDLSMICRNGTKFKDTWRIKRLSIGTLWHLHCHWEIKLLKDHSDSIKVTWNFQNNWELS